jgi:hypothetical protein
MSMVDDLSAGIQELRETHMALLGVAETSRLHRSLGAGFVFVERGSACDNARSRTASAKAAANSLAADSFRGDGAAIGSPAKRAGSSPGRRRCLVRRRTVAP